MLEEFINSLETIKIDVNKTDFFNYYFDVHTNRCDDYAMYSKYGHCV